MTRPRGLVLSAALSACSGGLEATSSAETATATASTSATDGMSSTSAATSPATTTTTTTTTTGGTTTTSSSTGTTAACESEDTEAACDPWVQDCCPGEKCTAWADNGGWSYNALRCAPVDPEPDAVGEPCTAQRGSGLDSCGHAAICWNVDPETNIGRCVALCMGSELQCYDGRIPCCPAGFICSLTETLAFPLCIQVCDPIAQDCQGSGLVCYGASASFRCLDDASGDMGVAGDPCWQANGCDPGLFCGSPFDYPGCDLEVEGCCTPFCDLEAPACSPGTECLPLSWLQPKDDIGVGGCMIPP